MLLQKCIEGLRNLFVSGTAVGIAGTVSINLFILAAIEQLSRVAQLSLA